MISDIDECKAETHNCDFNAFCDNTESSYNCTCEPGYLGDGWNCKGNWLPYEAILGGLGQYLAQRKSFCEGLSKVRSKPSLEIQCFIDQGRNLLQIYPSQEEQKKIEMCQWWWWEKMRRNEKIKLRISRKGKGWAKYCFFLKRAVVCLRQR